MRARACLLLGLLIAAWHSVFATTPRDGLLVTAAWLAPHTPSPDRHPPFRIAGAFRATLPA